MSGWCQSVCSEVTACSLLSGRLSCLSACLSVRWSVCPSTCMHVCLSVWLSGWPTVRRRRVRCQVAPGPLSGGAGPAVRRRVRCQPKAELTLPSRHRKPPRCLSPSSDVFTERRRRSALSLTSGAVWTASPLFRGCSRVITRRKLARCLPHRGVRAGLVSGGSGRRSIAPLLSGLWMETAPR